MISCPRYCSVQEGELALNEWFTTRDVKRPISDRKTDMIETKNVFNESSNDVGGD